MAVSRLVCSGYIHASLRAPRSVWLEPFGCSQDAPDDDYSIMASKGVDHQQEAHTDPGGGKNFRSHYYDKVGFRGVDERKVVDGLLAQSPVSISKCASFALKCSVPGDRRRQLWKLILGKCASDCMI